MVQTTRGSGASSLEYSIKSEFPIEIRPARRLPPATLLSAAIAPVSFDFD